MMMTIYEPAFRSTRKIGGCTWLYLIRCQIYGVYRLQKQKVLKSGEILTSFCLDQDMARFIRMDIFSYENLDRILGVCMATLDNLSKIL